MLRDPIEREIGKIGRAVLAIALTLATAMLVLAVVALVDLAMQPQLEGPPLQDHATLHGVPVPPEHARP
jgi:hypothetical protein